MNTRYVYPAIMTPEEDGGYSIVFPDLEGCYTCADDLADAIFMAEDVLALTLYEYKRTNKSIPTPSAAKDIKLKDGEFVNFISADTLS